MNLIKLTTTDQKLKSYNDNIRRCIKEEPDYFSEKDLVTSLDDLMSSYDSVINDPGCQKIISDVKDDLTDFTGVYIKDQFEFVSDYANEKIIDNNPFTLARNSIFANTAFVIMPHRQLSVFLKQRRIWELI